jgi:hypothetical protein
MGLNLTTPICNKPPMGVRIQATFNACRKGERFFLKSKAVILFSLLKG